MAAHIVNHGDVESSPMRSDFPEHKTILCIDDVGGMLGYQKALLERRGYKVLTADSARQGLEIAAVCALAAVILDYHMPQMNGGEVATEIRRLRPQIPIVMLSSDDEIPKQALNVVNAFVSKNEAFRQLLPVISRICGEYPPRVPGFQNHDLRIELTRGMLAFTHS